MTLIPYYPATMFEPPPLPDLSTKAERDRLSPSASKAFFNIAEKWHLSDGDAGTLLGGHDQRARDSCRESGPSHHAGCASHIP